MSGVALSFDLSAVEQLQAWGERNDVLSIYDYENFAVIDEIDIPDKIAALSFPQYLAMMDDRRHLAVFNLTPAMSVSIVDV